MLLIQLNCYKNIPLIDEQIHFEMVNIIDIESYPIKSCSLLEKQNPQKLLTLFATTTVF
jgi:hypothetical protein